MSDFCVDCGTVLKGNNKYGICDNCLEVLYGKLDMYILGAGEN